MGMAESNFVQKQNKLWGVDTKPSFLVADLILHHVLSEFKLKNLGI